MAIRTLLVANRAEIACRILRSARDLGLRTVAVHSDADADAPHVEMADRSVRIGPGPAGESYLDAGRILAAAHEAGADAIHPGYGFLSENADFAEAVAAAGLVFVGPPAAAIRAMGDKAEARRLMMAAGMPCLPGHEGDQSDASFAAAAARIGYPVMVKAALGGGGRGMRLVEAPAELPGALARARSEAAGAFGSDILILERAIPRPRHVEIQILADAHGACIHLGERDCSVQRRHQKVIEEAPSPAMTPDLRARMGAAAVAAARRIGYRGAGTVEFLLDDAGGFHFIEMNTRLQVEHPVTEAVTGLDLVALQIRLAAGERLPLAQEDVRLSGHAIEARLYAEDPARGFLPATGRILCWRPPEGPGIRVDAGIAEGQEVPPFYDPMLAKIVARGETREIARRRLIRALEETVLIGPATNAGFLIDILGLPGFVAGEATTALIAEAFPEGVPAFDPGPEILALGAAAMLRARQLAAHAEAGPVAETLLGWASSPLPPVPLDLVWDGGEAAAQGAAHGTGWDIRLDGRDIAVRFETEAGPEVTARVDGRRLRAAAVPVEGGIALSLSGRCLALREKPPGGAVTQGGGGRVATPMPGLLVALHAEPGMRVARGDILAVLEAMKLQHRIAAPVSGVVARVAVALGRQVASGEEILEIREEG